MPHKSKIKFVITTSILLGFTLNGQAARTDVYSDVKRMRISDAPEDDRLLGKLIHHEGNHYYIIDVDENLGFIASKLYGTIKYVPKIRKWNNNLDPNKIQAGQLLLLKEEPPFQSFEAQSEQLLRQLALKFDLDPEWYRKSSGEGIEIGKLVTFRSGAEASSAQEVSTTIPKKLTARERRSKRRNRTKTTVPLAKDTVKPLRSPSEEAPRPPELLAMIAGAKLLSSDKLGEVGSKLYEEKYYRTAKLFLQAARKKNDKHFQSWLQELFIQKMCGSESGLSELKNELKGSSMEGQVREQLLSIVDGQKEAACSAKDSEPDLKVLPAAFMSDTAEALQQQGDCGNSLLFAKAAREKEPAEVKPWIVEITCLKSMGQNSAAKLSVSQFVEKHPGMSQLPFLKIE